MIQKYSQGTCRSTPPGDILDHIWHCLKQLGIYLLNGGDMDVSPQDGIRLDVAEYHETLDFLNHILVRVGGDMDASPQNGIQLDVAGYHEALDFLNHILT